MKKAAIILVLVLTLILSASCEKTSNQNNMRDLTLQSIESVSTTHLQTDKKALIDNKEKVEEKVSDFAKKFIELAYLDLDINKKEEDFLSLFDEKIQNTVKGQFNKITLGQSAKRLTSINDASAVIDEINIIWDKNNKPDLALVDFTADNLDYRAGSARILGRAAGSLVVTIKNGRYKIFDYRIKENLKNMKEGK